MQRMRRARRCAGSVASNQILGASARVIAFALASSFAFSPYKMSDDEHGHAAVEKSSPRKSAGKRKERDEEVRVTIRAERASAPFALFLCHRRPRALHQSFLKPPIHYHHSPLPLPPPPLPAQPVAAAHHDEEDASLKKHKPVEEVGDAPAAGEGDEVLPCKDCSKDFIHSAVDQEFYVTKGWTNKPLRCRECRIAKKNAVEGGGGGGGYGGQSGGFGGQRPASGGCYNCGATSLVHGALFRVAQVPVPNHLPPPTIEQARTAT